MQRILLAGLPRSGSTWVGKILSKAEKAYYYHEPDNEKRYALTYHYKRKLHRFPYLNKDDSSKELFALWNMVFEGRMPMGPINYLFKRCLTPFGLEIEQEIAGKSKSNFSQVIGREKNYAAFKFSIAKKIADKRYGLNRFSVHFTSQLDPLPKTLIIKSVHCLLSLPWIDNNFSPTTIVLLRHPYNIISSYLNMKLPDAYRNIFSQNRFVTEYIGELDPKLIYINRNGTYLQKVAIEIGATYYFIQKEAKKNKNWIISFHEDFCSNSTQKFNELFNKSGLKWNSEVEKLIDKSNKYGNGYSINRVSYKEIEKWKKCLTKSQANEIKE
jgi:hypothetical protein